MTCSERLRQVPAASILRASSAADVVAAAEAAAAAQTTRRTNSSTVSLPPHFDRASDRRRSGDFVAQLYRATKSPYATAHVATAARQIRSHFARAVHSHHPRWRWNDPSCYTTLFATNALQCIANGEENPKISPFALGFRHCAEEPSQGHRQHAQKWQRSRVWFRRYPVGQTDTYTHRQIDRETHRHTHHNTSQPLPRAK